jgi:hypothetical protein
MTSLPNPFDSGVPTALTPDETAAAPGKASVAAADIDEHRFELDVEAFMEAIEPPPLFLQGLHELAGN